MKWHFRTVLFALVIAVASCASASSEEAVILTESPFKSFFLGDGGFDEATATWRLEVQENLSKCMLAQGFEYQPIIEEASSSDALPTGRATREWTADNGYGILSTILLTLRTASASSANDQYFLGLGESEQQAWSEAFNGERALDPRNQSPIPLEERGCVGRSILDSRGQEFAGAIAELTRAHISKVNELDSLPEVQEAVSLWVRCMAEQGWEYSNPTFARLQISDEFADLLMPYQSRFRELTPTEVESLVLGNATNQWFDIRQFEIKLDKERRVAIADFDCWEAHLKQVVDPLLYGIEAELLVEHGDKLAVPGG